MNIDGYAEPDVPLPTDGDDWSDLAKYTPEDWARLKRYQDKGGDRALTAWRDEDYEGSPRSTEMEDDNADA